MQPLLSAPPGGRALVTPKLPKACRMPVLTETINSTIEPHEVLCGMSVSTQPGIRGGVLADLPAALKLLQASGLPTADLMSTDGLRLWELEFWLKASRIIGVAVALSGSVRCVGSPLRASDHFCWRPL